MSILVCAEAIERYRLMKVAESSLRSIMKLDPVDAEIETIDKAIECMDSVIMEGDMTIDSFVMAGYGPVLENALDMFLITVKQDIIEAESTLVLLRQNKMEA